MFHISFCTYITLVIFVLCSYAEGNGKFWHVTDFHMDQNYSRTASPQNMCHGKEDSSSDAGQYGNYRCDSPLLLVNLTIADMHSIEQTPNFIIWTGDNLPHTRDPDPGWETIFEGIHNITELLKTTFPGIPIIPSIGNHDVNPPNLMPINDSETIYTKYLSIGGWDSLLSADSQKTFKKGGYFSEIPSPGLRIISLNTILWYTPNTLSASEADPSDQIQWLDQELKNATGARQKVYIIGHVPPGYYNRVKPGQKSDPTFHPQFHVAYLQLLKKYMKTISGQFYGHLHMDYFQLFQFDTGAFQSSSLLASSVTPWFYPDKFGVVVPVNPSIRLIQYSTSDFSLKDYDQYFLNLTKANSEKQSMESTRFEHLYGFCDTYKVPDLSTESLVKVYEKLKNNATILHTFIHYLTSAKDLDKCDQSCEVAQLCSISSTSIDEYGNCMHTSNGRPLSSAIIAVITVISIALLCGIVFLLYRRYLKYKETSDYESYMH